MEFLCNNSAIKFQLVVVGCDVKIFIAVPALCTTSSRDFSHVKIGSQYKNGIDSKYI